MIKMLKRNFNLKTHIFLLLQVKVGVFYFNDVHVDYYYIKESNHAHGIDWHSMKSSEKKSVFEIQAEALDKP